MNTTVVALHKSKTTVDRGYNAEQRTMHMRLRKCSSERILPRNINVSKAQLYIDVATQARAIGDALCGRIQLIGK